jgi:hypothetical protein
VKKLRLVAAVLAMAAALSSPVAAATDFGDVMMQIGQDAAKGYMGPGVTWFGAGMNSGWYNSSKSLSMFKLPVGISLATINFPFVVIDENMRTFDFSGKLPAKLIMDPIAQSVGVADWNTMADNINAALPAADRMDLKSIPFEAKDCPTIFGADTQKTVTLAEFFSKMPAPMYNALFNATTGPLYSQRNNPVKLPFKGFDWSGTKPSIMSATAFTIGVKSIPVIGNLQLGLRYLPSMKIGDFGKVGQFGLKIQHEVTQYIPVVKDLPFLHASAYWAMNNLDIKAGPSSLSQSNWVIMANASADAKFLLGLGGFVGLGYESSNLNLKVDMTDAGLQNFSLDIPGDNGFRFQVGGRLSLAMFDIFADANFGSVTVYNLGITVIGLNGL